MTMGNVTQGKLHFTPIATAASTLTVAAGAVGWVDTDASSITGTDTNKLWCVRVYWDASQLTGIRAHGEAVSNESYSTSMCFTYVDSSGHVDCYRGAANSYYQFVGYLT